VKKSNISLWARAAYINVGGAVPKSIEIYNVKV